MTNDNSDDSRQNATIKQNGGSEANQPVVKGLDRKFGVDVIWNLASLAFLATAGIILNLVIGIVYGSAALGVFNIAFAFFIVMSQFGVFGIHMSVLRYVPEFFEENDQKTDEVLGSGLVSVAVTSTLLTVVALLLLPVLEMAYGIDGLGSALLILMPGLWCFSVNKYLLNSINGMRHMKALAVFQSLRYILMIVALGGFAVMSFEPHLLSGIITFAEVILTPILLIFLITKRRSGLFRFKLEWAKRHLYFGARVFISGTVTELNTRVDVLMIGLFLDEVRAGIYSVAILIVEGLSQAAFVIRNNVNPLVAKFVADGEFDELRAFSRKVSAYFFVFMFVVGAIIVALFPFGAGLVFSDRLFLEAHMPLVFLIGGMVLASPYLPFNMMLSQSGKPGLHTAYMIGVLASNVALNYALIPIFGIEGAGLATAGSYVVSALLLAVMVRRSIGARIWI